MYDGRMPRKPLKKPLLMQAAKYLGGVGQLAKRLGVQSSTISSWLYSDVKIRPEIAAKIESITIGKFKANSFTEDK